VLPSFAEGLPVVIMEALALRRPVISTYVAGIPELVRPGETGWLVPAGDVDELVSAIIQMLDAPLAQLERMGHAGAARVARDHDIRTEVGKLLELIDRTAQD
jgi:glycosyltransferase involved in cell wall biosynthesis